MPGSSPPRQSTGTRSWRLAGGGLVVRAAPWGFGTSNQAPTPLENPPATDTPEADW